MYSLLLAIIYLSFIGLGLPDSLLGSAWPIMHIDIGAPIAFAGVISAVISVGTILSSFFSDVVVRRFGSGRVTAVSMAMTAVALFGFSVSHSSVPLILWAIPYGLGAGAVDAALNNFIALKYKPQHMSWLHCFWGVGASVSPYIMSFSLTALDSWSGGYFIVSIAQLILTALVIISLPLWKREEIATKKEPSRRVTLKEIFSLPGATPCLFTFFLYCAFELTAALWAASYLVMDRGMAAATASRIAGLYYLGITLGRAVNGFLAMKLSNNMQVRLGYLVMTAGLALVFIGQSVPTLTAGLVIMGIGSAPIYPAVIHMTPRIFGEERSQAMIGIQMAFAYMGFCLMPPFFGFIAELTSITLLPVFLLILLCLMILCYELVRRRSKQV